MHGLIQPQAGILYKAGIQSWSTALSVKVALCVSSAWSYMGVFGWNHGFAMVELTEAASKQKVDLHSRDEKSEGELGPA